MEVIDEFCDLLQAHANRDKVVCLACYALKLYGSSRSSAPAMTASGKLAGARSVMRLFDDPTALKNIISYGLGKQEGPIWGALGVTNGLSILVYLQFEKLMFLIDTGIWAAPDNVNFAVKTGHKVAWSLLAFFGLLRSLRALHLSLQVLQRPQHSKCARARVTQAALTSSKMALDVLHAVSWLPQGWLWGGRLTTPQASGAATASAVIAILMHYHGKRLAS